MRWMTVGMAVSVAGCAVGAEIPLTCEQVAEEVGQTLLDVADAHRTCTVAEDCQVVWRSVTCFQSCSDIVNLDGVAAMEAAMDEAEAGICAEYPACQPFVPPCIAPGTPDCVDGICVETF